MSTVATYLNLPGTTEQAFEFYKTVFGTDYAGDGIMRMGDIPSEPGAPEMPDDVKQHVMHVGLPILGGHMLMGTDVPGATIGNGICIMLVPETRDAADELFAKLSDGGTVGQPMQDMFWGDYYGDLTDRFGVRWMIDVDGSNQG